ncbi:FIG01058185: hypothetical protein [hydrothermal vent metagenome]|uniref:Methyltransferase domain-containing protein n=1 Tax=hydrothermal vent metagenome TaxID=652676 RepID=A0A3B1B8X7_9ZZZZ
MEYVKANIEAWNKRTNIHICSSFYDVEGFEAGNTSLCEIELAELQNVENKHFLHLQCHFGLDTLSWARKGAIVTGVDFSPKSIQQAIKLSRKLDVKASFVCSDVYEYNSIRNGKKFDVVFTSYGAICWLPCLNQWAKTVANCLKQGGMFYMVEFHPFNDFIDGESYFHSINPQVSDEATYTENDKGEKSKIFTWSHPVSNVVNALINEGLTIKYFNEFDFSPYNCFKGLVENEPGRYYKKYGEQSIPLVYSLCAIKNT